MQNLACLLVGRKDLEGALQLVEQAIQLQQEALKIEPQHTVGRTFLTFHYLQLGEILLALGRYDEVARTAEQLAEVCPSSWENSWRAADLVAHCELGERKSSIPGAKAEPHQGIYADRARDFFQVTLQRSEGNADARARLSWYLAQRAPAPLRDADKAVQLAQQATSLAPGKSAGWTALGSAYYRARNWKAACAALQKAQDLSAGGQGFDFFYLAMAHWQLGEKNQAGRLYDQGVAWMQKNGQCNQELQAIQHEAKALLDRAAAGGASLAFAFLTIPIS